VESTSTSTEVPSNIISPNKRFVIKYLGSSDVPSSLVFLANNQLHSTSQKLENGGKLTPT